MPKTIGVNDRNHKLGFSINIFNLSIIWYKKSDNVHIIPSGSKIGWLPVLSNSIIHAIIRFHCAKHISFN